MKVDIDRAKKVRKGENLDEQALTHFLRKNLGKEDGELNVQQFPSGFSNLTYLLEFAQSDYVLRSCLLYTSPSPRD